MRDGGGPPTTARDAGRLVGEAATARDVGGPLAVTVTRVT